MIGQGAVVLGTVEAIVARIGEPYSDTGMVLLPGCIESQGVVLSLWGHTALKGGAVAGTGVVTEEGDAVVFRGEFFADPEGRFAYNIVRRLGKKCQWSMGFRVLAHDLQGRRGRLGHDTLVTRAEVGEVSMVLFGACTSTQTLSVDGVPV